MSPQPADPLLVYLLQTVPNFPRWIRAGEMAPSAYELVEQIIAQHGSDAKVEWSHLAMICRQERALLQALTSCRLDSTSLAN